eukprot:comp25952_c0_seq1/m.47055 comp25952_c0_seq1/g.47055  ORF comp25952_c0_seq1/g.47055 comp25952_c0_seq1/m.47055 type:complete len:226 (-) comp25952_c0_seq1:331-1008(-)
MSQSKRDHHLVVTQDMYDYILAHSLRESPEAQGLREATSRHPRARMMGAPDEAQFLANIAKIMGAKKIIEVGTFTGYTALVLAQALPDDGKLVCLDVSTEFTEVGRPFWEKAGVNGKIDLIIAPAVESLDKMLDNGEEGQYDFAFIDANKNNYDKYYERLLKLVRKNGVIVVDNTLWDGAVVRPHDPEDEDTVALKTLNDKFAEDQRVDISFLGIADGVTILRKK